MASALRCAFQQPIQASEQWLEPDRVDLRPQAPLVAYNDAMARFTILHGIRILMISVSSRSLRPTSEP